MSDQTFDAMAALRRLEDAGMPRPQAEASVTCHQQAVSASRGDLATKADLAKLGAELRAEMAEHRAATQKQIDGLKSELLTMMLVQTGVTIGSVMALLTIFEFLRG